MERTSGKAVILFSLLAVATVGAASIDWPTSASPEKVVAATFLGFERGEERRYVIAPDGAMRDGEWAT